MSLVDKIAELKMSRSLQMRINKRTQLFGEMIKGEQAETPDLLKALDGLADQRFWQNYGLTGDGKGEPQQTNAMSHGCPPSRFRQINVLLTD